MSRRRLLSSSTLAAIMAGAALLCAGPALAQQPPPDEEEIPAAPKAPPPSPPRPVAPPPAAPPPAAPPPAAPAPVAAPASAEVEALRRELREQKARLDALESAAAARPSDAPPAPPAAAKPEIPWVPPIGGSLPGHGAWAFGAYIQAQYEQHQNSSDQLAQGGAYLNQDRFLVRRGRLRFDAAWEYVEMTAEIDGNTVGTPVVGPKRLNASLVWRGRPWEGRIDPRTAREWDPPLARLTVGLTGIPFGFELADSHKDRVFLERSRASSAFFPGEQDLGVVLAGGAGFFRYAVAAMNGEPLSDTSALPVGAPTHAKDLSARIGADVHAGESLRIAGGVSALYGTGFHAGTDASKAGTTWVDLNQNGQIDPGELTAVPAMAATPSQDFTRWAAGVDLSIRLRTPIGWSMLYGEVTLGTNLDRALFVADPVTTGNDVRELGAYAAFVQEVTRYGLVGFRFDYYDPNADFFQKTAGKLVPVSQAISTFAPVVGVQLPDRARLVFEYDAVKNLLALDTRGVPTNFPMNWFAVRLQVQL